MIRLTLTLILLATNVYCQTVYRFKVDLNHVSKDKVKITLFPPKVSQDTIIYVMPSAVPGSYAKKDYGRFARKFAAYDNSGSRLKIIITDNRDFTIINASSLARIEYWMNDTWDDRDASNAVFQSGGTNIEKNENFVINNFAFFGYIEGMRNLPFEITVEKPEEMYGSTYLAKRKVSSTEDVLLAESYAELADNPVMYCRPDTSSFYIDNAHIYTSVYSASGKVKSSSMQQYIKPMLEGVKKFRGSLPVNEYHFLFYFSSEDQRVLKSGSGLSGFGALEHKNCSFYFLEEPAYECDLRKMILEICAHEFMHTLTPLHLRSKEIDDFNYRIPEMSHHLWLYEGVTEYFSLLVLMQAGLMTEQEFFEEMAYKIQIASSFSLFAMTQMSKNVLSKEGQDQYLSVYSRGALLAWFMDMQIISLTDGKKTLKDIVLQLADKYKPGYPFNDDSLLIEMTSMVHPELQSFFDNYISGQMALDYDVWLKKSGLLFFNDESTDVYKSGPIGLQYYKESREIRFINDNEYFGFKSGDVLLSVNNNDLGLMNLTTLFNRYFAQNISGDEIYLKIKRGNEIMQLKFTPVPRNDKVSYLITPDESASELKKLVRNKISGQAN
jgi:predicted metalloprotease with PDZ domain